MPRPPRIFFAGAIHHIIARGNNQMDLFRDAYDLRVYRKLWIIAKARFNLKVYRWSFMPNHVHLLLEQVFADGVSEAMHFIQGRYARYFGRKYRWKGHVWESRYTNRLIADNEYFQYCAIYIENNPVKAGLVLEAEQYSWSSAAFYRLHHRDPLTDPDPYSNVDYISETARQPHPNDLFIGRRAVGQKDRLHELSKRIGKNLLVRARRSTYKE
jgi:putative transposase